MFSQTRRVLMLVLTRKAGESIVINDSIRVKVIQLSGGRVKLAFDAPPNIPIQREELLHREPSLSAASGSTVDMVVKHPR
jgi:carbon storage regulator